MQKKLEKLCIFFLPTFAYKLANSCYSLFTYILYANAGRKKYKALAYRNYRHFTQQCTGRLVIGIGTNNRIQWLNQEDLDPWTITPLHSSNSWYNACMQRKQSLVVNVRSLQKEKMRFICNFLSCFTQYLQLKILSLWLNLNWKRLSNGAELIKLTDATKENTTGKM